MQLDVVVVGSESNPSAGPRPGRSSSSSKSPSNLASLRAQALGSTSSGRAPDGPGGRTPSALATAGSLKAATSGSSVGGAPDDEIRQLVSSQRERSSVRSGGSRYGSSELEGVTLEAILGQGSFGVVRTITSQAHANNMPLCLTYSLF